MTGLQPVKIIIGKPIRIVFLWNITTKERASRIILNAIKQGNVAEGKKAAIEHIEKAEQFMLDHCTK